MKFRLIIALALTSISASVFAKSEFLDLFMSTYKVSDSSPLGSKSCLICHQTEDDFTKMTAYGRDLKKGLADAGTNALNESILKTVGAVDSNGSGKTNEEKIKAGTSPGDPGPADTKAPAAPEKKKSLIPMNFFHPAVVHFPIGLFMAGLLLDGLGLFLKKPGLLVSGWYNILMAAASAVGGVFTGFGAMYIQKVPFKGVIFEHMLLAMTCTFLMFFMVILRVHRHEKMHLPTRIAYFGMAFICLILISYAGHLGGAFVYGE